MTSSAKPDIAPLIDLIDKYEQILNASELTELEVEVGETALVLRKPGAFAPAVESAASGQSVPSIASGAAPQATAAPLAQPPAPPANAIVAPLTGLFYGSPSPGAEPYVKVGSPVLVGQVIGLIEAMKLFNEIKSDATGKVTRILVESGTLVKRQQPILEVDPG